MAYVGRAVAVTAAYWGWVFMLILALNWVLGD